MNQIAKAAWSLWSAPFRAILFPPFSESSSQKSYPHENLWARIFKRGTDILSATALVPVLGLVIIGVSALIKRDGGCIFYSQKRIGRNGEAFQCLKFRTMVPNAEQALEDYLSQNPDCRDDWNTYKKLKNDPRITLVGKFLRKFSLDELPQIINVLKGEMSLVGPRPILENERHFFAESYQDYLSVKPGITGLWQVSGRNEKTFVERVELDSEYVRNWTMLSDVSIIFKTFAVVFSGRGAY
ncbi:MAG: sugar transferase [Pseudomonadota bacterium]